MNASRSYLTVQITFFICNGLANTRETNIPDFVIVVVEINQITVQIVYLNQELIHTGNRMYSVLRMGTKATVDT